MPNHVTSTVIVSGDKTELQKLAEHVSSTDRVFDFRQIAPPPLEEPAYNDLPSQAAAKTSPNWWLTWNRKNWGTKWNCYEVTQGLSNEIIKAYEIGLSPIEFNKEQSDIFSLLTGNDKSLLVGLEFIKHVKMPVELDFLSKNPIVYTFQTAWNMPDVLFKKLSYTFPNLEFTILYADEDIGSNCGICTYNGGVCVDLFESNSKEKDYEKENFQQFACLLNNWDFEEYKTEEEA